MKRSALRLVYWGIEFGANVPGGEPAAGVPEGAGFVAGSVVGHDSVDGDAEALIVGYDGLQEGDGAFLPLIGHDPG